MAKIVKSAGKRRLSKAHREALSAAAKRRWAKKKAPKHRKKIAARTRTGRHLSLAEIEKRMRVAQRAIKGLRRKHKNRLRILTDLYSQIKALKGA